MSHETTANVAQQAIPAVDGQLAAETATSPLAQLKLRECAVVHRIDAPEGDAARLAGLGVGEGRTIELVQRGDPLIVLACGTRIGVARRLADLITVRPCVGRQGRLA